MCVYTADIYESRSDRFHDIYHEINVKNHSSANSLQVPYFLIRRAAKKVKFIANMRTDLRVCECVCILPIYTIRAVTVLTTSIGLYRENAIAVRVIDRSAYDATSRVHAPYLRNGCCIYYLRPTGSAHL